MADYATAVGFVQFPVNEREANGSDVRDITIRTPGTPPNGVLIRITLWPDLSDVEVNEGDFVAVDGKVTVRESDGKTYVNMDASKLAVLAGSSTQAVSAEREVVGKKTTSKF